MSVDPFTFEIIRHKLMRVVDEAVITLKHISGSSTTTEGHDLLVGLYRADGGLLMAVMGYLHALPGAGEACRHVLREYHENPGVYDGDVFLINDPYVAALHSSDAYVISPIFYRDKLVAWSANFAGFFSVGAIRALFPKLTSDLGISSDILGLLLSLIGVAQVFVFYVVSRNNHWEFKFAPLVAVQILAACGLLLLVFAVALFIIDGGFGVGRFGVVRRLALLEVADTHVRRAVVNDLALDDDVLNNALHGERVIGVEDHVAVHSYAERADAFGHAEDLSRCDRDGAHGVFAFPRQTDVPN